MRLFNNVRDTLEESMDALRRRDRMAYKLRSAVLRVPSFIIDSNDRLYSVVNKLYLSTFAFLSAVFVAVSPYVYTLECKYAASARDLQIMVVGIARVYIVGYSISMIFRLVLIVINVIANFLISVSSTKSGILIIRHVKSLNMDEVSKIILPLLCCFSLGVWMYGTRNFIKIYMDETKPERVVELVDHNKAICDSIGDLPKK
jgi:hypothetical protein